MRPIVCARFFAVSPGCPGTAQAGASSCLFLLQEVASGSGLGQVGLFPIVLPEGFFVPSLEPRGVAWFLLAAAPCSGSFLCPRLGPWAGLLFLWAGFLEVGWCEGLLPSCL